MRHERSGVAVSNTRLSKSGIPESVPCVHTTSNHYYGDACPGHHLDFVHLVEPRVVEDEDEPLSLADKLRRADTFPGMEASARHMGKVFRERQEAFESYNSETWNPEEGP